LSERAPRAEPDGPREEACRILLRVERAGAFAGILLERAVPAVRDPRDAALLHELVMGVLRNRALLDHVVGQVSRRPFETIDPELRVALRIGVYSLLFLDRVPVYAAVDGAVRLVKRGPRRSAAGFANGVLRQVARRGRSLLPPDPAGDDPEGLALHTSHPAWWVRRLLGRCGAEDARALLEADNRPVRPVLRPNLRVTGVDELADELRSGGLDVERCRYAPDALRVSAGSLRRCAALRENRAWVQDEASQLVPALFGERSGPRMADLCAAPGGKSLQLAERLPAGGFLAAVDRHRGRLGRMATNLLRLGIKNVGIVQADMTATRPALRGPFDGILVDAPCSGTGTFRRHPEIRWRLRQEDLKLLAARQRRILDRAASLLAPGGRLVYAVCSMEPEEGEQVVHGLLASRPDLAIADARASLPAAARRLVDEAGFLRTSPADGGLDGFFAAALDRRRDLDAGSSGR